MEGERPGAGEPHRTRRGVLHGPIIDEADIQGWLNRPAPRQQCRRYPAELPEEGLDLEKLINSIEKDLLLKALERSNG